MGRAVEAKGLVNVREEMLVAEGIVVVATVAAIASLAVYVVVVVVAVVVVHLEQVATKSNV